MGTSDEENGQGSRNRRCIRSSAERGQTTLDFAIGISIFLTVLLLIFFLLPGILSPFTESAHEETIASNRVADKLANGMLGSTSEPYVLDSYCTVQFLAAPDEGNQDPTNIPASCNYVSGNLEEQVGVAEGRERVRVTMRGDFDDDGTVNILCWDHTGAVVEDGEPGCDVTLARGDGPSENQESITAVRTVSLNDAGVSLYVEVW